MKLKLYILFISLFAGFTVEAQATQPSLVNKLDSMSLEIYVLLIVILVLLIVTLFLAAMLLQLASIKSQTVVAQDIPKKPTWFQRLNETVAIEDEDQLDLNHNYDGIRELDNKTPSWWSWAFYGTIAFAVVYLLRAFVFETMPDQITELKKEYEVAEILKAQIVTQAANNIDENNVNMLDQDAIIKGSMTFSVNCAVCHGPKGEGNAVGPNLADEYWIHKGGIKDIFTSIKYGWPDKGMKPWKDDFSPIQIAELSSFVKSLAGTNPPNGKEKQGELWVEPTQAAIKSDSIPIK